MSGRRSSSAEGRPGGTPGTPAASGPAASVRSAGGCPGQHRDGVLELRPPDAEVDRLRLRGLELRLRPCTTSERATMPALYWFWAICSARR